ncbi:MAG: hypothetical protein ABIE68_02630 [bacterium]
MYWKEVKMMVTSHRFGATDKSDTMRAIIGCLIVILILGILCLYWHQKGMLFGTPKASQIQEIVYETFTTSNNAGCSPFQIPFQNELA